MLLLALFPALFFVNSLVTAFPVDDLLVFESLPSVPQGWTQQSAPPPSKLLKFHLAISQLRALQFEQKLIELSTPGHKSYGKHMKRDELKDLLNPALETSEAVTNWLTGAGVSVSQIEDHGQWINFLVPCSQAEAILDTKFYSYRHEATGKSAIRSLRYSLPQSLHRVVHMIQPTTRFGQPQPQVSHVLAVEEYNAELFTPSGYNATFCNTTITPACLRGIYSLGNFAPKTCANNTLGVSGYLESYPQFADLDVFISMNFEGLKGPLPDVLSLQPIDAPILSQNYTGDTSEGNLDVQYAVGLTLPNNVTFYYAAGRGPLVPDLDELSESGNTNEPYLDQLNYLLSLPDSDLPTVLSTSYGEDEQSIPRAYANWTCYLFAQLGARGVSVIFSSGDTGPGSACQTNDGTNTTRFNPIFPASCPFVTSVGGTMYHDPEIAAPFSSGGFSDYFTRPTYQDNSVKAYLDQLGGTFAGLFDPNGRGIPDVAAQSVNFTAVDQGAVTLMSGTSCAAPTFAGIISNLNSIRIEFGYPVLGFLNPWLYALQDVGGTTDIVQGGSVGCTGHDLYSGLRTPVLPGAGWNATVGWDPVTGLGSPNFPRLVMAMATTVLAEATNAEATGIWRMEWDEGRGIQFHRRHVHRQGSWRVI